MLLLCDHPIAACSEHSNIPGIHTPSKTCSIFMNANFYHFLGVVWLCGCVIFSSVALLQVPLGQVWITTEQQHWLADYYICLLGCYSLCVVTVSQLDTTELCTFLQKNYYYASRSPNILPTFLLSYLTLEKIR